MSETMANTFLYFAYGSNMFTRRLIAPNRTPSAVAAGTGFVAGRRFTFDKVSKDGSGKCDIEPGNPADRVYGVLFRIVQGEVEALDRAEGLGAGYRKETVQVVTADRTITAIAYVATEKEPACKPYSWYKAFVVAGAAEHGLPSAYIEHLRTIPAKLDPNADRRSENEAVLFGG
jgi:cation transport regulator ChaC